MANKEISILGTAILPGESKTLNMEIARLHTMSKLKVPIIIERAKKDGPVVLFTAALHGDEINGTEIVRQIIVRKINKPKRGTIICIPVINIFGFVKKSREFPDGRDLNRVFPGSPRGSLAARFAWHLMKEIVPNVDYCVDFHAGGASRFNAPQIRIVSNNPELKELSDVFNAPFTLYSKNISGSFRNACGKVGVKMLLYEGGKSLDLNYDTTQEAVRGSKRLLEHLNMLNPDKKVKEAPRPTVYIERSTWIRATFSGLLQNYTPVGKLVEKGEAIALITDPFGKFEHTLKSPHTGYIINSNDAPIVYQGDAVFHVSVKLAE